MPSLQKLHKAVLTLENGDTVEVERIGKGRFTTAWADSTWVYLQTRETDYAKEILEGLRGCTHIPETESLGWASGNAPYRFYRQPRYRKLRAKHKAAWADFRALQICLRDAMLAWTAKGPRQGSWAQYQRQQSIYLVQMFAEMVAASGVRDSLKRSVQALADETCNYGDSWSVEICARNLAVHPDRDELILLDPVFDTDKVH
jgi:hypothetical protein